MRKNVNKLITIIIFILILIVPNVSYIFLKDKFPNVNTENRKLASKPELDNSNIMTYFSSYSAYYNDNLPYRTFIKSKYSKANYYLFNYLGNNCLSGKDGWIFYINSDDGNPVAIVQGKGIYSKEQMEKAKQKINSDVSIAKDKGIDLYYLVIPNKENIYRDKLPDSIKIYDNKSNREKLIEYINNSKLIYLKDKLLAEKNQFQLYMKQDTHWNEIGAFFGYQSLISSIKNDNSIHYESITKEFSINTGDMIGLSGVYNVFSDYKYTINYDNNYEIKKGCKGICVYENKNAKYQETIMIVGDSYRTAMIQYLSADFKTVIHLHRNDYKKKLIDEYKPNIIISEYVERYFNPNFPQLFH